MIDEFVSLFQPLATLLMLALLAYVVHGYIVRQREYNQYPYSCTTIYKPEKTKEDKHLFEDKDPWVQEFVTPPMKISPDLNTDYETFIENMNSEENNVVGK